MENAMTDLTSSLTSRANFLPCKIQNRGAVEAMRKANKKQSYSFDYGRVAQSAFKKRRASEAFCYCLIFN